MSYEALISDLDAIQARVERNTVLAASSVLAEMKSRVFEKGLDASGSEIKNVKRKEPGTGYSKRPFFTDEKSLINKSKAPKASKSGFISLPEGYKSFREFSGRQTAFVDLDYSSVLRNSVQFELIESGFVIGIIGGGQSNGGATAIEKADFADWRNGSPIFALSDSEIDLGIDIISR